MNTETNHRSGTTHLTTTVDHIETVRRVTLVERGAVWADRVVYDSTTAVTLTRKQRATQVVKQPQHRHVFTMWLVGMAIFAFLLMMYDSFTAAAVFAPAIQETFTHWSMT